MGCFECHCGYGEDEESDDPELTRLSQQAKRKEQDAKFGRCVCACACGRDSHALQCSARAVCSNDSRKV